MKKIKVAILLIGLSFIVHMSLWAQNKRDGRAGNGGGSCVFSDDGCEIMGGTSEQQALVNHAMVQAVAKSQEGFQAKLLSPEEMKRLDVALTKGRVILSEEQRLDEHGFPFYGWTNPKSEGGVFAPIYIYPEAWKVISTYPAQKQSEALSKLLLHESLHKVFPDLENEQDIDRLQEALSGDIYCEKTHTCLAFPQEPSFVILDLGVIRDRLDQVNARLRDLQEQVRDYMDEHGSILASKQQADEVFQGYEPYSRGKQIYALGFASLYEKRKFKEFIVNLKANTHEPSDPYNRFDVYGIDSVEFVFALQSKYNLTYFNGQLGKSTLRNSDFAIRSTPKEDILSVLTRAQEAMADPWMYLKQVDLEKFKYLTEEFYLTGFVDCPRANRSSQVESRSESHFFVEGGSNIYVFTAEKKTQDLMQHECKLPGVIPHANEHANEETKGYWLWPWNWWFEFHD